MVRGRTRRTTALESQYLLDLKAAHPALSSLAPDSEATSSEILAARDPKGWSLMGVASTFRYLVARVGAATFKGDDEHEVREVFPPEVLVRLFDHYLDCEELPDRSDVWSRIEDTILRMDRPPEPKDPNAVGNS